MFCETEEFGKWKYFQDIKTKHRNVATPAKFADCKTAAKSSNNVNILIRQRTRKFYCEYQPLRLVYGEGMLHKVVQYAKFVQSKLNAVWMFINVHADNEKVRQD